MMAVILDGNKITPCLACKCTMTRRWSYILLDAGCITKAARRKEERNEG